MVGVSGASPRARSATSGRSIVRSTVNAGNWAILSSEGPRSVLERGLRSLWPNCHHAAAANAVIQTDAAIQSSGLKERDFVGRRTTKLGASIGATGAVSPLAGDHATEP